ncbi:SAG-related sequence [Besnoitia besnoiti]|uniref:SAG-related sequence n=1 Tax=Besnoitia besnoiti TaxID=94643 RepID=A0A2A9MC67_BESBE|nr:SAG-related sequence [Besnoitia besnoiti]PFH36078.1 SAG-related sequence [Besnoitia besnoiti]
MAVSLALSLDGRAVPGTVKRPAKRLGRATCRSRLPRAAVLVVVASFSLGLTSSLAAAAAAESTSSTCETRGKQIWCNCGQSAGDNSLSAVLSRENNVLSVTCPEGQKCAPSELKDKLVCQLGADAFTSCALDLHTLLAGRPSNAVWKDCSEAQKAAEAPCKTLTLPQENFPFIDAGFFVGCEQGGETKCTVAVTLEARPSTTEGQIVTCAYGTTSNPSHQAVTLNPSQNSLTLVCGDKGEVLPQRYDEAYCSSELKGDEDSCEGNYSWILPGYDLKWWTRHADSNSFTLSIPPERFPAEEAKIIVGCRHTKAAAYSQRDQELASSSTVCNVDVTIEASLAVAVSPTAAAVFGVFAGAAVMTVLSQDA